MISTVHLQGPTGVIRLLYDIVPGRYPSDDNLLYYLQRQTLPEPEVVNVLMRALRSGDHAIDAGANAGFFTVLMSKLVGPEGRIIAVEPDQRNLALLLKNLDINECANVSVVEKPLGQTAGACCSFHEMEENGQSSMYPDPNGPIADYPAKRLFTTTIDSMLPPAYAPKLRLLKMDIEGAEGDAISGCSHMIPIVISEMNDAALRRAGCSGQLLVDQMRNYGHRAYVLHPDGSLPSEVSPEHMLKFTKQNANMLFTRPKRLVEMWPEVEV